MAWQVTSMVRVSTWFATFALPISSYSQQIFSSVDSSLFPLEQNAGSPGLFAMPPCGTFNLEEASIDEMQAAMVNGTLTSVQLCLRYMQRTFQTQELYQVK